LAGEGILLGFAKKYLFIIQTFENEYKKPKANNRVDLSGGT